MIEQIESNGEGWMSIPRAAGLLGINRSTLWRQVKKGAIRSEFGLVNMEQVLIDRAANINTAHSHAERIRAVYRGGRFNVCCICGAEYAGSYCKIECQRVAWVAMQKLMQDEGGSNDH